jgi:hypothetical protein
MGLPDVTPGTNTATDSGSGPAGALEQEASNALVDIERNRIARIERFISDSSRYSTISTESILTLKIYIEPPQAIAETTLR